MKAPVSQSAALAQRREKSRRSITRRGAAVAGGAVALLIGGILVVDGWMMVLGICGLLILTAAFFLSRWNIKQLELQIHLPGKVHAGSDFEIELCLLNHRRLLDAFQIKIELYMPGETLIETTAPWTPSQTSSRLQQWLTLPSRGFSHQHPLCLSSDFPLGLFRPQKVTTLTHPVTVAPRQIVPMELNEDGSSHDADPQHGASTGHSSGEPRGVRPWQPGDPARRIHWPASARSLAHGHGLRVREYDPPGFHPDFCQLVFHSFATGGEMLREDRFERAISLLSGAVTELYSRGIPTQITADFLDWQQVSCRTRAQWIDFTTSLARVSRSGGIEAHDLQTVLQSVSKEHTLMIVSDMPPASWQHLLDNHPHTLIVDIRQVRYRIKTVHTPNNAA
ncbi:MAG: DUF58 domain-containing protein [Akkermansiaceae bacterium]